MNGLQTQLHGYRLDGVDLFQQGHYILTQTVGAGTNGKTHNILRSEGFGIQLAQSLHRSVCVGKGLEIGNEFFSALKSYTQFRLLQLFGDVISTGGKGTAAITAAENAAACAQSTVPVGAGEAGIDAQFIDLAAEFLTVVVTECDHIRDGNPQKWAASLPLQRCRNRPGF